MTTYRITYTDGTTSDHTEYRDAIAEVEETEPDAWLDGPLADGRINGQWSDGDRTLCWASEGLSEGDSGAKAFAQIVAIGP